MHSTESKVLLSPLSPLNTTALLDDFMLPIDCHTTLCHSDNHYAHLMLRRAVLE